MHPILLENEKFLRNYSIWQNDPRSVVFVSVAEMMSKVGMIDEAINICNEGLKNHPQLVSGHISLGKIFLKAGKKEKARAQAMLALSVVPGNPLARELLKEIDEVREEDLQATQKKMNEVTEAFNAYLAKHVAARPTSAPREPIYDPYEDEVTEDMPLSEVDGTPRAARPRSKTADMNVNDPWTTLTMAKIYASQGMMHKARLICKRVLISDPGNNTAHELLSQIGS